MVAVGEGDGIGVGVTRTTIYDTGYYDRLLSVPRERVLCVDVETTGLDPEKDEILQLAMVDGNGDHLLCTYVRPDHRRRWPKAQEVHGITWAMVKGAPTMDEVGDEVQSLIDSSELIIGYNISFDQSMLKAAGVRFGVRLIYDVMDDYAQVWGRWSDRKGDYLWAKLSEAARRFGITLDAHDAASDATATVRLFYAMLESDEFKAVTDAKRMHDEQWCRDNKRRQDNLSRVEKEQKQGEIIAGVLIGLIISIPILLFAGCVAMFL